MNSNLSLQEQIELAHTIGLSVGVSKRARWYLRGKHPIGTVVSGDMLEQHLCSGRLAITQQSGKGIDGSEWDYELSECWNGTIEPPLK